MLFNSINFALFFPVVFLFYWFVFKNSLKWQNILLFAASYFFYACWDWRFLFLLAFSTILDFYTGLKIYNSQKQSHKKNWLYISVFINLGFLGVFKYYNFFADTFEILLSNIGLKTNFSSINLILPVGISFYTFHGLSYVFDIYNKKIKPTSNWIDYTLFVSFFPLLVAGPIERATHLLPQVEKKREFDYLKAVDGLRQILWGLFKKVVIADTCAQYVNTIFLNPQDYYGSTLILGAILFAFQIYGDFSGYTDMALGIARLLGFELLQNFNYPYFSRDIAEFWRRWHISLSSWFKDYLYIPLGGSQVNTLLKIRNTLIIFIVSGFWHGANWTFIIWGTLNAIYIIPSIIFKSNRNHLETVATGKYLPSFKEFMQISLTFTLSCIAWVFFRAATVSSALEYFKLIFSRSSFHFPQIFPIVTITIIIIFVIIEWIGRENKYALETFGFRWPKGLRILFYYILIITIFTHLGHEQQFIYFQF